jgi:replicative DNA helicase
MLRDTIDASRRICNSAIIMEHHAPKRGNGDKVREVTAYGSGLFLKWPDFGFAMVPSDHPDHVGTYVWEPMRGPRVRGRAWPMALRTGKANTDEWPWEECERPPSAPKGR